MEVYVFMKTSYNEKLLRINLTTNEIKVEPLNLEIAKKFIGARGLGTKILLDEIDPNIDPLSNENKLVIMTVPVTGAAVPTGGRYVVVQNLLLLARLLVLTQVENGELNLNILVMMVLL